MIENQNIICFGSATWEYPGLQQTVMRHLAKKNRVIFFNSIATRKIRVNYDLFLAVIRRTAMFSKRRAAAKSNILVNNPRAIPLTYNFIFSKINNILIKRQCQAIIRRLNFSPYILWIGTPMAAALPDLLEPMMTVYNPVDRYHAFSFVDADKILASEHKLAKKADVILCTSEAIKNDLLPFNSHTYNVSHGVDFRYFNSALLKTEIPEDIKYIKKPVLGYFGGLSERVDYGIISKLAEACEHATILLIGARLTDISTIEKYPNVLILGEKNPDLLPMYLKVFDVCLIPYHVNELMEGVDPIKLKEYFCAGKPVVSTDLPEVRKYGNLVYIGKNPHDFVDKSRRALEEKNETVRNARIRIAQKNDWSVKIEEISAIIDEFAKKRQIVIASLSGKNINTAHLKPNPPIEPNRPRPVGLA